MIEHVISFTANDCAGVTARIYQLKYNDFFDQNEILTNPQDITDVTATYFSSNQAATFQPITKSV